MVGYFAKQTTSIYVNDAQQSTTNYMGAYYPPYYTSNEQVPSVIHDTRGANDVGDLIRGVRYNIINHCTSMMQQTNAIIIIIIIIIVIIVIVNISIIIIIIRIIVTIVITINTVIITTIVIIDVMIVIMIIERRGPERLRAVGPRLATWLPAQAAAPAEARPPDRPRERAPAVFVLRVLFSTLAVKSRSRRARSPTLIFKPDLLRPDPPE